MGGVAKAVGLGGPSNVGSGGAFKMTSQAKQAEQEMIARLRGQAAGTSPSITGLQYQQAMGDIAKQQQSAAASSRGVSNAGLLARQAMMGGQQAGVDIANQAAAAKLQEQRSADEQLQRISASQRGVALQSGMANQQAQEAQQQRMASFVGNLGGSAAMAFSDENLKEEIKPSKDEANKMVDSFMDALKSYTYEYKNKKNGNKENPEGEVTSVMAQDLEKSELGKKMVKDTPEGKMVDYAQGMAPLFAAIAELNSRTKKLEGK
jgi:hypothetical protein